MELTITQLFWNNAADIPITAPATLKEAERLWDAVTGRLLHSLSGHTNSVISASFSPDGRTIVTASRDKTALLWNTATGELLHTLSGHTLPVNSAAFSPDGRTILTTSDDRTARLWDAAS